MDSSMGRELRRSARGLERRAHILARCAQISLRWRTRILALALTLLILSVGQGSLASVSAGPSSQPSPQSPRIEATLSFSSQREQTSLGDPLTLTLNILHPDGWTAVPQRLPQDWGDFELRWQGATMKPSGSDDDAGMMRTIQLIGLRPWMTGSLQTPAMGIQMVAPGASQSISLSVEGARVQIRSVLPPGESLPRDIRPQAVVPSGSSPLSTFIGLLLLALAILGVFISRRLAEARRQEQITPAAPPVPPLEAALAELARIEASDMLAGSRFKAFYEAASDVLRRYIQRAFAVDALDRTRGELDNDLEAFGLPADRRGSIAASLVESDLVKFARLKPELEQAMAYPLTLRSLLHELDGWREATSVVETSGIAASELGASDLNAPELGASELDASKLEPARLESAKLESKEDDAP
jgi:hypothetical protein